MKSADTGSRASDFAAAAVIELHEVFCVHRTSEGDAASLQGMTLTVGDGEILGVLGPSGAGKSTLLRVIAGLQAPSAGEVQVLGCDVGRSPARARSELRHTKIGFLGQRTESALSPDLSVCEAVALPLVLRGLPRATRRTRVTELLDATGLRDHAKARPAELSGGERQRVALCAALAHEPSLLLADEPTGELDEGSATAVRELIAGLVRSHGATAVVVSHDPTTAAITDRTVRIRDGRVVEDQRDGEAALVVGRGGWVRLPPELLTEAGIGARARVSSVSSGLIVSPAVGAASIDPHAPDRSGVAPPADVRWTPAQIELRSLSRSRGQNAGRRQVIDALTLEFARGRMTAVTGRSGVGKTTLLRLICGLDKPDGGELLLDQCSLGDRDAEELASLRRERIGYLPQEPSPISFLSAEENVRLTLRLRGWGSSEAAVRAAIVLARVGLAERARQHVARLSAGEAQRVALARALASARGLLIVDEPTSRLDEASAADVAGLLASAAAHDGQTVICATHDDRLIGLADEVIALG